MRWTLSSPHRLLSINRKLSSSRAACNRGDARFPPTSLSWSHRGQCQPAIFGTWDVSLPLLITLAHVPKCVFRAWSARGCWDQFDDANVSSASGTFYRSNLKLKVATRARYVSGWSPTRPTDRRSVAHLADWSLITRHPFHHLHGTRNKSKSTPSLTQGLSSIRRLSIIPEWHGRCRLSQEMRIPDQDGRPLVSENDPFVPLCRRKFRETLHSKKPFCWSVAKGPLCEQTTRRSLRLGNQ